MKKKTKEEYRGKSVKELMVDLVKKRQEISHRRMEIRTGRVKNTSLCRLSDEAAIIRTLLTQKNYKEKLS